MLRKSRRLLLPLAYLWIIQSNTVGYFGKDCLACFEHFQGNSPYVLRMELPIRATALTSSLILYFHVPRFLVLSYANLQIQKVFKELNISPITFNNVRWMLSCTNKSGFSNPFSDFQAYILFRIPDNYSAMQGSWIPFIWEFTA